MTALLSINHLSKNYQQQKVINDLSFSIKQGELFSILGPNGAGQIMAYDSPENLKKTYHCLTLEDVFLTIVEKGRETYECISL